jgi:hypothetical protein
VTQVHDPTPAQLRAEAAIVHRMEALERDNRRLRRYGVMMLTVLAIFLGVGASLLYFSGAYGLPGSPQMVAARQFLLRDARGTIRGTWGTGEDGSVRLALNDDQGRQRIRLSLLEDGSAGLTFADTADRKLAVLGLLPDQTTTLALTDPAGVPRMVLGVAANGSSNLVFADHSGTTRAGLGVDSRGIGTFTLADRSGGGTPEELLDTLQAERSDSVEAPAPPGPAPRGRPPRPSSRP